MAATTWHYVDEGTQGRHFLSHGQHTGDTFEARTIRDAWCHMCGMLHLSQARILAAECDDPTFEVPRFIRVSVDPDVREVVLDSRGRNIIDSMVFSPLRLT